MRKLNLFLLLLLIFSVFAPQNVFSQSQQNSSRRANSRQRSVFSSQENPQGKTQAIPAETNQSVVYFTKDVSSEGLLKVYNALNQKIEGNVGIKISFGGANEQILDADLLRGLVQKTGGTMFDGNGLSGNRWTSAMNLALAKANGFSDVGKCVMVSDSDSVDLPVENGYFLKYARTGKEFADFDTLIAVHRVKLHYLPAFGGNIKNITLCLANRSGKCIIHSGGTDENRYHNTEPDVLMKSYADAAKAALDYKKNWAFINVLDDINPEDGCRNAKNQGKIGIIASNDIVALEQCAVDFLINNADIDEATKNQWKTTHQTGVIEYAESLGCGTRNYRLVELK